MLFALLIYATWFSVTVSNVKLTLLFMEKLHYILAGFSSLPLSHRCSCINMTIFSLKLHTQSVLFMYTAVPIYRSKCTEFYIYIYFLYSIYSSRCTGSLYSHAHCVSIFRSKYTGFYFTMSACTASWWQRLMKCDYNFHPLFVQFTNNALSRVM